jgi:hypothetical protein
MRMKKSLLACLAVITLSLSLVIPAAAVFTNIYLISTSTAGVAGNNDSNTSAISADGRYVAFQSASTNLLSPATAGRLQVYRRDRMTNQTVMVSVNTSGAESNGVSWGPAISADGRYVVFDSNSSDIVASPSNSGHNQIYRRDMVTGTTVMVSVVNAGNASANLDADAPDISADGRYVIFTSYATNLDGATASHLQIFRHDMATGINTMVSRKDGTPADAECLYPAISDDGNCAVFISQCLFGSPNSNVPNTWEQVIWTNMTTGSLRVASENYTPYLTGYYLANDLCYRPRISGDGRYVTFSSFATNLDGFTGVHLQTYRRDMNRTAETDKNRMVSINTTGIYGNGHSEFPDISSDGRWVTFLSMATDLVPPPAPNGSDRQVYLRDMQAGLTTAVSKNAAGAYANNDCSFPRLRADAGAVAFHSAADNLAAGGTFNKYQVYYAGSPYVAPQTNVTSGSVTTVLGTVNFNINNGSINGLAGIPPANILCGASGYSFPYGFFTFNITNLAPGGSVQVTIRFPNPLPAGVKYYKCINGRTVDCSSIMTRIDPYTLQLTLTDGGLGDADGTANGAIADPGGPAFPLNNTPQSSSPTMPAASQKPVSLSNVTVKSASLSATKVTPGAPVIVTANLANTGTGNGTANIKVYVNGSEESQQGVTVNSGGTSTVTFDVTRNEPGTYTVYVGGTPAGSFTVDQFTPDTILYISAALIFFALIGGTLVLLGRRRAGHV